MIEAGPEESFEARSGKNYATLLVFIVTSNLLRTVRNSLKIAVR